MAKIELKSAHIGYLYLSRLKVFVLIDRVFEDDVMLLKRLPLAWQWMRLVSVAD